MKIFNKVNIKICCIFIFSAFGIYSCQTETNETSAPLDNYSLNGKWELSKDNNGSINKDTVINISKYVIKDTTIKANNNIIVLTTKDITLNNKTFPIKDTVISIKNTNITIKKDTIKIGKIERRATQYYKSIEFFAPGDYLLTKIDSSKNRKDSMIYFLGKYEANIDQTFSLTGDTKLELVNVKITDKSISFNMNDTISISATRAKQFPVNIDTDLLCRKWKDNVGNLWIFSKSGTFIKKFVDPKVAYFISDWKWKTKDKISIKDYGVINIEKNNIDTLKYIDKDEITKIFVVSDK